MRCWFSKLAGTLLLSTAISSVALAQQRADQLGAAAAVQSTDGVVLCQGCDAATPLTRAPFSSILTFLNANLSLSLSRITSGLASGVATFLGTPSSANQRAMLTDETGNGAAVFQGGDLGTISGGNLAAGTGYTVGNLAGLGTGAATWLGTPSSANLRATLTDETGTGAAVFGTAPTMTGVILGDVTGSTQCLQANSSGVISGSGSLCGGSGSLPTVGDLAASFASIDTIIFGNGFDVVDDGSGNVTVKHAISLNSQSGASYTVLTTDGEKTVRMTNGSATTVNLLAAATAGANFGFYLECDSGCTIDGNSAETIDGAATLVLAAGQKAYLSTDGAGWRAGVLPARNPHALANITGLGTGVATALGTPSSANLRAAITDETGTGAAVFGTAPTMTGVILGDVTGSTQCLQANTSGVVSGTGSACGAGGGGGSAFLQFSTGNATFTTTNVFFGAASTTSHLGAKPISVPVATTVSDLFCTTNTQPSAVTWTFTLSVRAAGGTEADDTNQQVNMTGSVNETTAVNNTAISVPARASLTIHGATSSGSPNVAMQCTVKAVAS